MGRTLSFRAEDDFDDKLYSVSKKRGVTKSAFINQELKRILDAEYTENNKKETGNVDVNLVESKNKKKMILI